VVSFQVIRGAKRIYGVEFLPCPNTPSYATSKDYIKGHLIGLETIRNTRYTEKHLQSSTGVYSICQAEYY